MIENFSAVLTFQIDHVLESRPYGFYLRLYLEGNNIAIQLKD